MARLIKRRRLADDHWQVIQADDAMPANGDVLVPLSVWQARPPNLLQRNGSTGVWLGPTDDPADVEPFPDLVAVHFPVFTDGRGYSTARLLRQRYGFTGELRAIGDVLRDQLYELARCGFDSFLLRDDQDAQLALRAFDDFSDSYQGAADQGALFERRFRRERSAA